MRWRVLVWRAYKYPRRYVMVESMPLGPTGKILKRDLRVLIQRG